VSLPEFKLIRPRTLQEAMAYLSANAETTQIIAGGTDLIPSLRQRLFTPQYVLDLSGIADLRGIKVKPGQGVEIGALTTLTTIEDSGFIEKNYPVLREAAMTVASPILRNMGTLGGNICLDTRCLWYNQSLTWRKSCGFCIKKDGDLCHVAPGGTKCWAAFSGDCAPALLTLDAEVEVVNKTGRRTVPLAEFYTGEGDARMNLEKGEILTKVFLPEETAGWKGAYLKLRIRGSIDYPLAGVAVAMKKNGAVEEARVAITAVNPAPVLVRDAPNALKGKALGDGLEHAAEVVGELAARTAKPLTTSALTPEYRREMVRVFAKRAVMKAARS